jgi:cobalt-zinc-cadmium efflux system outer membrane protein
MPGGRSTESSIQVFQTFDISGRRELRREAAGNRLDAARFDEQDRRLGVVIEVRRLFGEALYRQQHRAALIDWIKRIDSAVGIVTKLAGAGEASGYDRRRLEREAQTVRARVASAAADYSRAREVLRGLTGEPAALAAALDGTLMPDASPSLASMQRALRQRPDLASLHSQAAAFDRERSAAERAWVPDVTLGLGHKRIDELNRADSGVMLALSMPIPVFDRGQAGEQRARAKANILRAEQTLKLARSEAELSGIWQQAEGLRKAAEAFRRESLGSSRDLTRIAEAAYRAGEGGVLELLDAYRAELEVETTALDLELRARLARIELDALSGEKTHE